MKNILTLSLVLLFGCFLFTCGMPTYPYLYPPSLSGSAPKGLGSDNKFEFKTSDKNNDAFYDGYEVYYKFYPLSTTHASIIAESISIDDINQLLAAGYLKLYYSNEEFLKPIITIDALDKNDIVVIEIDFSRVRGKTHDSPDISRTSPGAVVYPDMDDFRRRFHGERSGVVNTYFDKFLERPSDSDFQKDDSDLSKILDGGGQLPAEAFLVLYAVTYGREDLIYDLYSKPLYLGYIKIETN